MSKREPHPVDAYILRRKAEDPGFTKQKFCDEIGFGPTQLWRMISGDDNVGISIFEAIERVTGGELTAVDLFSRYQERRRERAAQASRDPAAA